MIEEIEVEGDDRWDILYYVKDWNDHDYGNSLHICEVGYNFNDRSFFCPLPVKDFLAYYGELVDWKWDVTVSDNKMTITTQFDTQTWTYDTSKGVLITYSTDDYAYSSRPNKISNFDISLIMGVLGISILGVIYTIRKKVKF